MDLVGRSCTGPQLAIDNGHILQKEKKLHFLIKCIVVALYEVKVKIKVLFFSAKTQ